MDRKKLELAMEKLKRLNRLKDRLNIQETDYKDIVEIEEITFRCRLNDGYMTNIISPGLYTSKSLKTIVTKNRKYLKNEIAKLEKELDEL